MIYLSILLCLIISEDVYSLFLHEFKREVRIADMSQSYCFTNDDL